MSTTLVDAINARFFAQPNPAGVDSELKRKIAKHLEFEESFWAGSAAPKMSPTFVVRFAAATGLLGGLHESDLEFSERWSFEWTGLLAAYEEGIAARRAILADKTTTWVFPRNPYRDILRDARRMQEADEAEQMFRKRQMALVALHPEVEELHSRVEMYEAMLAKAGLL